MKKDLNELYLETLEESTDQFPKLGAYIYTSVVGFIVDVIGGIVSVISGVIGAISGVGELIATFCSANPNNPSIVYIYIGLLLGLIPLVVIVISFFL